MYVCMCFLCPFHYRFTWGGQEPPVEGDFVIVPKGQTLSIDVDTPVLRILLIDGGTVLFDDNQNVSLHSEHILVVKGGLLQVRTYVRTCVSLRTSVSLESKILYIRAHAKKSGMTWQCVHLLECSSTYVCMYDSCLVE